jgi:hypothetical protein
VSSRHVAPRRPNPAAGITGKQGDRAMSAEDMAKNTAGRPRARSRNAPGRSPATSRSKPKGHGDQAKGNIKQASGKAKDAFTK